MAITTINVNALIHTPDGTPLPSAEVVAILDHADIDASHVVPETQTFTTDANGQVVMPLWPNSLGVTESRYRIKCKHPTTSQTVLDIMATVPHESGGNPITEIDLYTIAEQPAYAGKNEVAIATANAVQAALDAQAAEAKAKKWADETEDTAVETGKYSAKHHAAKAAESAALSQGVETMSVGDLGCPLLHLPLKNSLNMITGVGSVIFTRSVSATRLDRYGVVKTAAIDEPRFEKQGLLIEGGSTNDALHCRDITNAAWVKSGGTAALDATGRDGVANAASSFTATAANAYFLQLIANASQERTFSIDIKRRTGTGIVLITQDGWVTNTDITAQLSTTDWARVALTATVGNANFGILLSTAGDAVEIDYAQNEAMTFATSRIVTTAAPATRSADDCMFIYNANCPAVTSAISMVMDIDLLGRVPSSIQSGLHGIWGIENETYRYTRFDAAADKIINKFTYSSGVDITGLTTNGAWRVGHTFDGSNTENVYLDGELHATGTGSGATYISGDGTNIYLGRLGHSSIYLYGHISNFRIYDTPLSTAMMRIA